MRNIAQSHRQYTLLLFAAVAIVAAGCTTKKAYVRPAKQVERNFFTCKGFDRGLPVDATSEFSVTDGLIYVVADLEKEQVGNRLDFEMTSPLGKIAYFETMEYRQDRPHGVYFDVQKLLQLGGEGRWKVLFWADGQPVGRLTFDLGEVREETKFGRRAAGTGDIFERLFGEEARPADIPGATAEESVPAMIETPEGISLTPGIEPAAPEAEAVHELKKQPEEPEQGEHP